MAELFSERYTPEHKIIICNEGSSRSSKTWDTFHLIVAICDANRDKALEIYILRETLVDCRDFTLEEFKKCLKVIGIWNDNNYTSSPKPVYNLWGHAIKFRGLDDEGTSEGYPSDILFFNEVLNHPESGVKALIMRCRMLVVMDWNPKYTEHWVYAYEKRSDTVFTRTTYKNNRHLERSVINEIEACDPWHPDDYHLPEDDRRPHPVNVPEGTAGKYRWKVYGLGQRCNKEGLVFASVKYIDAFPVKQIRERGVLRTVDDVEDIAYGMDFGRTAQTAIVKLGVRWTKPKPTLFLQKLFYAPTESSSVINEVLKQLNLDHHLWSDNNMPGWVSDLRNEGHNVFATRKFDGSREYWISTLKKFNLVIVKDPDFQKEQENFSYRVVDGKQLSETIKKFDHLWSASGYGVVGDFRYVNETPDNGSTDNT